MTHVWITPFQGYRISCRPETQGCALGCGITSTARRDYSGLRPEHSPCLLVPLSPCHAARRGAFNNHERATARRGAVLIMALVSLVLVAALMGTIVRWAAMEHKLIRVEENESRARWLAEAGIERAAAQLAGDADYSGETWDIAAPQLPSGEAARVRLKTTPVENQEKARSIEVEVEYGLAGSISVRLHKEVIYEFPSGETP